LANFQRGTTRTGEGVSGSIEGKGEKGGFESRRREKSRPVTKKRSRRFLREWGEGEFRRTTGGGGGAITIMTKIIVHMGTLNAYRVENKEGGKWVGRQVKRLYHKFQGGKTFRMSELVKRFIEQKIWQTRKRQLVRKKD